MTIIASLIADIHREKRLRLVPHTSCSLSKGCLAFFLFFAWFNLTPAVLANTITVTANCTLNQAITTANDGSTQGSCASGADNAADTINFEAGATSVTLSADLPQITETLSIDGGTARVTINGKSGSNYYKLFVVKTSGAGLTLQNLIIKDAGNACVGAPSTCDKWLRGGAVQIEDGASLTIINSVIENGYAGDSGGAIHINNGNASGNVTIRSSVFRNSYAFGSGGILNWGAPANGVLTIEDSLFENNQANDGGAIKVTDRASPITVNIKRSVFRNNTAHVDDDSVLESARGIGGAISAFGSTLIVATIENSTFYGNEAKGKGGALYLTHSDVNGSITLKHLTIAGNTAPANQGGGIIIIDDSSTKVKLLNSLLANNGAGKDCGGGSLNLNVGSLSQDGSCANSAGTGNPRLGAVSGAGARAHYPLTTGSPALDAADAASCLSTDQLGTSRPKGASCDIGAIEFIPPPPQPRQTSSDSGSHEPTPVPPARTPPAVLLNEMGYEITAAFGLYSGIQCKRVGPAGVGIQWILDRGFIDAIDCWGYVEQGVRVCFPALGAVVFLDASTSPRSASENFEAYITANRMTCVSINKPGTIVLLRQGALPDPEPTPDSSPQPTETPLQNCMVTTLYTLNFRAAPGGDVIGGVGYMWTLTALAKSGDWYKVDNNGVTGWISAKYVSARGVCG